MRTFNRDSITDSHLLVNAVKRPAGIKSYTILLFMQSHGQLFEVRECWR